jgi:nucleoid DNA-binding protein
MAGLLQVAKAAGANPIRCPHCGQQFTITKVLEMIFICIMQEVREGGKVSIRNFGTFSLRVLHSRTLRNPFAGGREVTFPDRKVMSFRQSAETKRFMNRFKKIKPKTKEGEEND